jgi:hypothetical protein
LCALQKPLSTSPSFCCPLCKAQCVAEHFVCSGAIF